MKILTQSVNFNADRSLISFTQKKIGSIIKYHDNITGVEIFFKVQKTSDKKNKITEVKINLPGAEFIVKKETKSFEEGVNLSIFSLKRQLKKFKEKQRVLLVS